ncbi:MAG: 50S ribosomal protein L3 [Opitutaceae bacterium]|jgi:large subunit ribosomal protein L3|nr:50S ribosomal protein L3 [Opitutaceae bacterium]
MNTLLGKKLGMTQIYDAENVLVPVTVVEAGPCPVVQVKTTETDGYNAIQLGFSKLKPKNATKPAQGHAAKAGLKDTPRVLNEVRLETAPTQKAGDILTVSIFKEGQLVDAIGISKGKGFQGVMRKGAQGGPAAHGSMFHRRIGSIGMRQTPGRTWKNQTMPGHIGRDHVTTQNLLLVKILEDKNLLLVKGAIPGANGDDVIIRSAIKGQPTHHAKAAPKAEAAAPAKAAKTPAAKK